MQKSRWYSTVYIRWLVASYDTHKGKCWLNSDHPNHRGECISNATEVTEWAAPGCSRPQAATDDGVRDGIVIMVSIWQETLRPFQSCRFAKKEGSIQYGYRKWGTNARVFSQTLAHGNSKN